MTMYDKKCARCGKIKPITDFPMELAPINSAIIDYCVPCATILMEMINDPKNWKSEGE